MKLVTEDHIIIQFVDSRLIVKKYGTNSTEMVSEKGQFNVQSGKYAVSQDDKLMGYVRDIDTVALVQLQTQALIDEMKLPQGRYITGITFSSNNSLYISASDSYLYVIDPTPCP